MHNGMMHSPMWSHRAVQEEPGFSTVISPWKSLVVHSSTLSLSPIMLWVTQFSHPLSRNCRGRVYGLQKTHWKMHQTPSTWCSFLEGLMRDHLLLGLDQLAGQTCHKILAPLLWDFCVVLSKLVRCCGHAGSAGLTSLKCRCVQFTVLTSLRRKLSPKRPVRHY